MNSRLLALRTMPYEDYLKTPEWKEKRNQALARDEYRCRACNSSENLNVHHRTYENRGNEGLNDLTTFCQSCHEHFHRKISQMEIMERTHPEIQHEDEDVRKKRQAQKFEDYLIGMLIQDPSLLSHVCGILSEDDFAGLDTLALYRLLNTASPDHPFEQSIPSDLLPVVSRLTKEIEKSGHASGRERQVRGVVQAATSLKRKHILRSLKELQDLIAEATKSGDIELERQLRQRVFENKKLLCTLYTSTHVQG